MFATDFWNSQLSFGRSIVFLGMLAISAGASAQICYDYWVTTPSELYDRPQEACNRACQGIIANDGATACTCKAATNDDTVNPVFATTKRTIGGVVYTSGPGPYGIPAENGQCDVPPAPDIQKNNGPENCTGNPINAANGNKFEVATDYASGQLPFRRSYNRFAIGNGAFGARWEASYFTSLIREPVTASTVTVSRWNGKRFVFTLSGADWLGDADVEDRLVQHTDVSGNTTSWEYTDATDDSIETYDPTGRLISIAHRDGQTYSMSYSTSSTTLAVAPGAGLLIGVSDAFGHGLTFVYDTLSRVIQMTDAGGGTYLYAYGVSNTLTSVTFPGGAQRTYVYNEPANTGGANLRSALTGIIDESNVRYATFKYDTQGRAISTEHGSGLNKYTISYGPAGSSSVTDPLSTVRNYSFQTLHGVMKNTSSDQPCSAGCGSNAAQSTGYDANGNIASKTDFNGNITNYSYDLTRNLETSRTEAYGTPRARTITTQWHSTFRVPTQIDEPGKRTTFTHDSNGNVLTKTMLDTSTSESRTWTYTYNSFGQVLTANGPRTEVSDVTTYTYYSCTTGYQCG